MRTADETRALFDQWAQSYDEDLKRPIGILDGYETSLRLAAETVELPPNAKILDIGIGTGAFAALFTQSSAAQVFGLDVSEKMLEQCRSQHPRFSLQSGGFYPIPHADESFHVVVSSFAFHETPPDKRPNVCLEIARVLKSGGILCLLDIMFASPTAVEDARRVLGRFWDPSEVYAIVGDLDTDLRAAGFRALSWRQTAPCHWVVTTQH
jgi:ubiquinone/menaquinone biosynthesis C-methylase UbiE